MDWLNQRACNHMAATLFAAMAISGSTMALASPDSSSLAMSNRVTVASGVLVGNPADTSGVISFKGIPYAAPPVGALRWKAPEAALAWTGDRDATKFGAKCWAAAAFGGPVDGNNVSEDCLFLNVWTGAAHTDAKLPVMVFIHGGGFQFGTASTNTLDGTALAIKGVVLVTLNYRLGVFGYLARPDLDAESQGHQSGMYGIEDQVAALRWVKENISAFGGDPGNVTVFGESAGAHSVGILMASPVAAGLFQKAIGQSGAFWESEHGEMKGHTEAKERGVALGRQLNADTLDQLRALPALQLETATNWSLATDPATSAFSPTIDGYVLPESPYQRFVHGRQNDVPLLAGWNTDEGAMFFNRALAHQSVDAYINAATNAFGADRLSAFLTLYPATTVAEAAQSARLLVGDQVISAQMWAWINLQQRTGRSPVYAYHFEQTSPYNPIAMHTTDVPYVFGNLPLKGALAPGAQDIAVSETMRSYWTNFARTGNPNSDGLPEWPRYAGTGSKVLRIGAVTEAAPEEGTERFLFLMGHRSGHAPIGN